MSILDTFKTLFGKPEPAPEQDKLPHKPKLSTNPRKLPSPPIMKNPKVQEIVKKNSGYNALQKISMVEGKESKAIVARWDARVYFVKPEDQEWADGMCCQVPSHKERHGTLYAIKGSWALKKGLITKGAGVVNLDDEHLFDNEGCICCFQFIQFLQDLPYSMLTEKGKQAILQFSLTDTHPGRGPSRC